MAPTRTKRRQRRAASKPRRSFWDVVIERLAAPVPFFELGRGLMVYGALHTDGTVHWYLKSKTPERCNAQGSEADDRALGDATTARIHPAMVRDLLATHISRFALVDSLRPGLSRAGVAELVESDRMHDRASKSEIVASFVIARKTMFLLNDALLAHGDRRGTYLGQEQFRNDVKRGESLARFAV